MVDHRVVRRFAGPAEDGATTPARSCADPPLREGRGLNATADSCLLLGTLRALDLDTFGELKEGP